MKARPGTWVVVPVTGSIATTVIVPRRCDEEAAAGDPSRTESMSIFWRKRAAM